VPLPQLLNFQLARDLVVLDELGHLSFAQTGGQLLFHLVSKLCERTWVIVTTNLAFGPGHASRCARAGAVSHVGFTL
jgi:DNA replication protein DnaC